MVKLIVDKASRGFPAVESWIGRKTQWPTGIQEYPKVMKLRSGQSQGCDSQSRKADVVSQQNEKITQKAHT